MTAPSAGPVAEGLAVGTARGTLWNVVTFGAGKGSLLIATVVLARLLTPQEFGLLALGLLVIVYLDVMGDAGVGAAVIYREDTGSRGTSTAVLLSVAWSALLTLGTVLAAPAVAVVFDEPAVTDVVRVLALAFFVQSLGTVQRRKMEKELDFRRRAVPEVSMAVVKGGVAIGLALAGFGVWALVWGQVAGAVAGTVLYWALATWRFSFAFDGTAARELLRFGLPVTLLGLLAAALRTADVAVIGRRLDAGAVGLYTIAYRLPELLVLHFCYLASGALFPAYAKARGEVERLRAGFRTTLRMVSVVVVPVALGLAVTAPDLVPLAFGDQWQASVPVTQALAVWTLVYALAFNVGDVYKATGRPGILNGFAVLKLALTVPLLWIVAPGGILRVALALLVVEVVMTVVQLVVASRLLRVPLVALAGEYVPALAAGGAMVLVVLGVKELLTDAAPPLRLTLTVVVGVVAYTGALTVVSRDTTRRILALGRQLRSGPGRTTPVPAPERGRS